MILTLAAGLIVGRIQAYNIRPTVAQRWIGE